MLSYPEIACLLRLELNRLPKVHKPVGQVQIPDWLDMRPFHEVQTADQACREFAATREWPTMENDIRAQVFLRVHCAIERCECRDALVLQPPEEFRETLELLLVDLWHKQGREWATRVFLKRGP